MKLRLNWVIVLGLALATQTTYGQSIDPTDPEAFEGGTVHILPNTFSGVGGGVRGNVGFNLEKLPAKEELASYKALDPNFIYRADPSLNELARIQDGITHQPLIHIKVRVIEVQRQDDFQANSILQYLSNGDTAGVATTLVGNSSRGFSNFVVPGLITNASAGSGALINLTSDHVNWVASFLATEFDGDLVTAPQVTTLNGKNVTFRAGAKVPFQLGSNVIQNGTSTVQQFLYKHVGTYVSVTPQIVNWDSKHAGGGVARLGDYASTTDPSKLPVKVSDIGHKRLPDVLKAINQNKNQALHDLVLDTSKEFGAHLASEDTDSAEARKATADVLSRIIGKSIVDQDGDTILVDRNFLAAITNDAIQFPSTPCLKWRPEDCTINLNVAVRLSEEGNVSLEDSATNAFSKVSAETNVRAISNIVQVKSGNGVVIGGLISMRDQETVQKIPVLGDLPYIGAGFRAKQLTRSKYETLIFLEAAVLPPFESSEHTPRSITSLDFCNARNHLEWDYICCSALYCGLQEAALTNDYLPPLSDEERAHLADWKISTQLHDLLGN